MKPLSCVSGLRARCLRIAMRLGLACVAPLLAAIAFAQIAADGRITGRIFNPATQQYVRNAEVRVEGTDVVAYSGDDGSYVLTNVPGSEVSLTVTYTGYDVATARVSLGA